MSDGPRINRNGRGASFNWVALLAFAGMVASGAWWLSNVDQTLKRHGEAIARIELKIDEILDHRHLARLP